MLHVFNKVTSRMAIISIALDAGARSEGDNFSHGLAHMMEHMCFKGTKNRSWQKINREVAFIGGQANAYTSHEQVVYYIYAPLENIEKAMDILSDQIFNSEIPENEFLKELEVVKQEEIGRSDSPVHEMYLTVNNKLMPGRLASPVIGTKESISGFTQKELVKFYKKMYTRKNMIVGLSANLTKRRGKALLTKYFGRSSGFSLTSPTYSAPDWKSEMIMVNRPNLEHTYGCVCLNGIDIYDKRDGELDIANHILGVGMDSRLFEEARERRGLAYSIGSGVGSQRESGNMIISFQTEGKNLDEILEVIDKEVSLMASGNITEDEFDRAKNSIKSDIYSMQDSTTSMNSDGITRAMFGHRTLEEDIESFNKITIDDVKKVISDVLSDDRKLTVICQSQK